MDWRENTQASKAIKDFVHNNKFLFAKVSRFCLDCRAVNAICEDEHFWPKKVDSLVHALEGMVVGCKLDLRSAFHNLVLDEDSRDMTAFQTPFGKYRYTRLAMGFKNASHMLCRYLSQLVGDLPSVILYYDDILLMAQSKDDMFELLELVLERLDNGGLSLNPQKCILFCSRVEFLGNKLLLKGSECCQHILIQFKG
jgi:putative transposase